MNSVIIGIDASRVTQGAATGTERYSRQVIDAILRQGSQHEYRLYVRNLREVPMEWSRDRVCVIPIRTRRLWTHVGLAREIGRHPPDALFIPAHVLPFPQAIHRTTRTVVTIHDVGYRHFPQAHPWHQRLYLDWSTAFNSRYADRVVVDSQATCADVRRFYSTPFTKLHVVYPGPTPLAEVTQDDANQIRTRIGLGEGRPYALFIGTLQPRKNLRRLIEAWAELARLTAADQAPLLIIAGAKGWGGEDLPGEVRAMNRQAIIRFTGYVDDMQKSVLLRGARVFAFPSLYEGFGFPVLEAQSAGVPVVCANTSSLPEVAGDGALLVDPMDVQALTAALRQALYDEELRNTLIARGSANLARFTWEECARRVLELLVS